MTRLQHDKITLFPPPTTDGDNLFPDFFPWKMMVVKLIILILSSCPIFLLYISERYESFTVNWNALPTFTSAAKKKEKNLIMPLVLLGWDNSAEMNSASKVFS